MATPTSPVSSLPYLPTLQQSPLQGSNLPMILKQLSGQPSSLQGPNIAQAGQQAFNNVAGGDDFGSKAGQGNALAPGGWLSPFDSYTNESGDLISGGQVIPG